PRAREPTSQRDVQTVRPDAMKHAGVQQDQAGVKSPRRPCWAARNPLTSGRMAYDPDEPLVFAEREDLVAHTQVDHRMSLPPTGCGHVGRIVNWIALSGVRIDYFGAQHQLLGALHRPQRLRPRSTAVLLCNPFGEEASRAHRMFRVLATQLER